MKNRQTCQMGLTRREGFLATIHGRGHVDYYELAAKKDGTMLGLRVKLIQDVGSFHMLLTPAMPTLSVLMLPGLYRFKNVHADVVGVFTHRMATDLYRGAGRPEATHGIERMVEILAAELNMDPVELRMKNFVPPSDFPMTLPRAYPMTAAITRPFCRRLWTWSAIPNCGRSRARPVSKVA